MSPALCTTIDQERAFLHRVIGFLAEAGVGQYLFIGSDGPECDLVLARQPQSRVCCVDVGDDGPLRDPDRLLAQAATSGCIDFAQPLAMLLLGVLHRIPDADGPAEAVARLRASLLDDSYLVISHLAGEDAGEPGPQPGTVPRQAREISGFFGDLALVKPGLVHLPQWRPELGDTPADTPDADHGPDTGDDSGDGTGAPRSGGLVTLGGVGHFR